MQGISAAAGGKAPHPLAKQRAALFAAVPHRPPLLAANAPGPVAVNSRCINCGTCWAFDPQHFAPSGEQAHVYCQPSGGEAIERTRLASIACPVAAIQLAPGLVVSAPASGFPTPITRHSCGEVFYCGWASPLSFGASSWFIRRPDGNVLVDSPRWSAPLARLLQQLGGVRWLLLTHRDDVADHQRWAQQFGCERWIHAADADAAPEAEQQLQGEAVRQLVPGLQLWPVPGHTAGSMVVLLGEQRLVLFSGDHLWWNPRLQQLEASETHCWWNWPAQLRSLKLLQGLDVAWLLPGHGSKQSFGPGDWDVCLRSYLHSFNGEP